MTDGCFRRFYLFNYQNNSNSFSFVCYQCTFSLLLLCYITQPTHALLKWQQQKKSNSTFFFASIYFILQSIINLFFRKLSFKSFFVSNLGTKKCEYYCSNNILLSTWTISSFISSTKTLLLKENEKMLQGFFLPQKKKKILLFRGLFRFLSTITTLHHSFRPTFVTNECFC